MQLDFSTGLTFLCFGASLSGTMRHLPFVPPYTCSILKALVTTVSWLLISTNLRHSNCILALWWSTHTMGYLPISLGCVPAQLIELIIATIVCINEKHQLTWIFTFNVTWIFYPYFCRTCSNQKLTNLFYFPRHIARDNVFSMTTFVGHIQIYS